MSNINKFHAAKKKDEVVVVVLENNKGEKKMKMEVWDCGSPLYDSYELASVTHLIERHLMILPSNLGGSKPLKFHHHHDKQHQMMKINNRVNGSTAVVASSKSKGEYVELSRVIGCMGNYSLCRKMRGGKIMKIKIKKFKPCGINKWFK